MVVEKTLYIAFLIHKVQFAFQAHALKISLKLGLWGTLGGCMGCPLVKSGSLRIFCHKADRSVPPDNTLSKNISALVFTESEKCNRFMTCQRFSLSQFLFERKSRSRSVM